MGSQVLGGGVIVAVAVALWLVYLLPSWHSRHQFNAAERNAVRLNQALRVLAETSESSEEVRLELNARTALAKQKLAKKALVEREHAELDAAREDLERARRAREHARALPAARRARARRRARAVASALALVAAVAIGWGTWQFVTVGATTLLWVGAGSLIVCGVSLQRMSRVARRAGAVREAPVVPAQPVLHRGAQDIALSATPVRTPWQPRALPKPLTSSAGSAASVVRDAEDAREALRRSALEEAKRQRAAQAAPPSIDTRRAQPAASAYASMGYVDDSEIEAHVRHLLRSRATG